ncbi:amidohydrolase [Maribacter algarum]|uniref:Amidohydrolase n=1 Tax=Maribacter algarum (ex Zhang et al. 2020) TaxID=2578118 RepID=A0A5S3PQ96_9FLAO|nr:amidohydrolase [Maribacter algarum]TMM56831.1 amidohydrolase [Maribacter algarum]
MNPEILSLRKEIHENPELSGFEYETAKRIRNFIVEHHPTTMLENLGGTGVAAIYKFPKKGPSITIRCELDALPIQEVNDFEHQSKNKGVSHKCGHDGHMAIVSGLIFWLKEQSFDSGEVILLFQPAEENGEGAYRVLQDERFKKLKTDYIFALHNIPKEPLHSVILMKKGFSAEVQSLIIRLKGKESHAAEPENGINPALGLSELVTTFSSLEVINPEDENFTLLTPVHLNMGQKAYGVSPANGELHYTMRAWSSENMSALKTQIKSSVEKICQTQRLAYELEWLEHFPAAANDVESNIYVSKAAKENNFQIIERPYPFKFGEDFGWFSKEYKTAMFGLGAGEDMPALHNADYDFPDELLDTGIAMFKFIISSILKA